MNRARIHLIALLAALSAGPAAAQEWQVARESFAFAGSRLTILVEAEAGGTLRVIRGAPGSVRVASRAPQGFTAAGLAERDELILSAAGVGPVDYMVSVPDEVWIEVRLPGRSFGESMAGRTRSRTFHWTGSARDAPEPVSPWIPPLDEDESLYTTFSRDLAPAVVSLPDLTNVRSVSVRIEPGRFRVISSRPLSVADGAVDRLEIRPNGPPLDLIVTLPTGTHHFRLVAGDHTALLVQGEQITALCSPMIQQWLSHGRRWLTFNPGDGTLDCTAQPAPRHEG